MTTPSVSCRQYQTVDSSMEIAEQVGAETLKAISDPQVGTFNAEVNMLTGVGRTKTCRKDGVTDSVVYIAGEIGAKLKAYNTQARPSKDTRNELIQTLAEADVRQEEIAEILSVSQSSVSQTLRSVAKKGA